MRLGSISLLLALGVMGVTGCAGGGSLTANSSAPNEGAYNPVPSIDALPPALNPSTYAMPASAYDLPPGQTNAGGVGTGATTQSACTQLCNDALALNCPVTSGSFSDSSGSGGGSNNGNPGNTNAGRANNGNGANTDTQNPQPATTTTIVSPDECASQCVQSFTQVPCPDQFAAAIGCFLEHVTLTCDLLAGASDQMTLEQDLISNCQTALIAFGSCVESSQGAAQQPQGQDCNPGSCGGCPDACTRCDCDGNAKSCSDCINN